MYADVCFKVTLKFNTRIFLSTSSKCIFLSSFNFTNTASNTKMNVLLAYPYYIASAIKSCVNPEKSSAVDALRTFLFLLAHQLPVKLPEFHKTKILRAKETCIKNKQSSLEV